MDADRRTFLKMLGAPAVAAALPGGLDRALEIPAHSRSGSIDDVEHVIFLMQENRSFDHYFGTLRGVRGFGDPHPVTLPSGKSVWHQPAGAVRFAAGGPAGPDVEPSYEGYSVVLKLHNGSPRRVEVTVRDRYGSRPVRLSLRPHGTERQAWRLARTHGWYDLTVTVQGDDTFECRYAGHLENGEDSISDPAMGGLI